MVYGHFALGDAIVVEAGGLRLAARGDVVTAPTDRTPALIRRGVGTENIPRRASERRTWGLDLAALVLVVLWSAMPSFAVDAVRTRDSASAWVARVGRTELRGLATGALVCIIFALEVVAVWHDAATEIQFHVVLRTCVVIARGLLGAADAPEGVVATGVSTEDVVSILLELVTLRAIVQLAS